MLDDFNREALAIEIDINLPARIVRALDQRIEIRGKPQVLRTDNGPEFIGAALGFWGQTPWRRAALHPTWQAHANGYIESFNRTYREEVLNCYVFEILVRSAG